MPTVCFRISFIACELSPVHRQTRACCAPRGGTGAERKGRMTHLNFSVSHICLMTYVSLCSPPTPQRTWTLCVHTNQQEMMSVPVTWETETVAKIP